MYTHLDSLGPEAYMKSGSNGNGTAGQQIPIENNTIMLAVIFSGICVVLIFVLLGFIFKFKRQLGKNLSISSEMHNIQSMMNAIEKSYLSGKIDREQRDAILAQYREELAQLENLKKDQSQHILSIDGSSTEISDYEQRLKNLKDYLKSGVISRADYDAKSVQYQTRINELKAAIQRDESGISENKQKLTSIIEEDEEIRGQVKKVSRSRNIPKNRTKSAVPASKGKFASRKDKK
jgi:chromosome segregation ATPase